MQITRADAIPPTPWRNGGGQTRELLALPAGSDWQLRLSLADIDRDGPFSAFPGVQRHFAVLEGDGVRLDGPGWSHRLQADGEVLHFDGAQAPACRLLGGPTRDLNLMLRGLRGSMQRVQPDQPWDAPWPWRALFCAGPARLHVESAAALTLAAHSLVCPLPAGPLRVELLTAAPAFWLVSEWAG